MDDTNLMFTVLKWVLLYANVSKKFEIFRLAYKFTQ